MKKVIDAFMFFNELDMLDFHLHAMNDSVDYFVICEATQTHSGKDKPLFLKENFARFEKFKDKIIHLIFTETLNTDNAWDRESAQRQYLLSGIEQVPNIQDSDIILISDTDEIVSPELLNKLGPIPEDKVYALEQDMYYYNLNNRFAEKQYFTKLCNYGLAKKELLFKIRNGMRAQILRPGGWHFSYFGNFDAISTKLANFAHQDLNLPQINNQQHIQKSIDLKIDLFGRDHKKPEKYQIDYVDIKDNTNLPKHYEMLLDCENWHLPKP